ncbi:MAG: deoxyribonuclease IV [Oscillospiraceae bacterium]|nr:deoxyribonuclease IV [Oscillospiraceae bacterium]MBQ4545449.1 deoxyribonuclease IV [Oscillospiraceae bacterium]
MLRIGCHLSSSKGYLAMGKTAKSIGANTFQFFTRNPRGGAAKPLDPEDISAFLEYSKENDISQILAHAPYTLNAASKDNKIREFALMTMRDDIQRLEHTPGSMYNFHPGSHVGQGTDVGITLIVELLNEIITPEQTTTILLETMAGKGSEIGGKFEEIYEIMSRVKYSDKLGVCLDTCHVFDGGYDIKENLDGVISEFDKVLGIEKLCAVHLNDSLHGYESHKDRHAKIGEGHLGTALFAEVINHPKLSTLPFYLETPNELDGYRQEIELLKSLYTK